MNLVIIHTFFLAPNDNIGQDLTPEEPTPGKKRVSYNSKSQSTQYREQNKVLENSPNAVIGSLSRAFKKVNRPKAAEIMKRVSQGDCDDKVLNFLDQMDQEQEMTDIEALADLLGMI